MAKTKVEISENIPDIDVKGIEGFYAATDKEPKLSTSARKIDLLSIDFANEGLNNIGKKINEIISHLNEN